MSKLERVIFLILLSIFVAISIFLSMGLYEIKHKSVECVLSPSAEQQIEFIKASKSYSGQWCRASGKSVEYCNDDWLEFMNDWKAQ